MLTPTVSQVIPDNTLDTESSIVTADDSEIADLIKGGAVRGTSLFHSFEEFGITTGERVYFANPNGIANILSRVTGNNVSEILGTLGVKGSANLFLLNPNGIVFGENAALDLNGSFLATTADSFEFAEDGYSYAATNPDLPPLLKVNIPVGLQFGSNAGEIEVQGTGHNLILNPQLTINRILREPELGLQVREGNTLALVGGDINLRGGNLTAPGGKIVLGSLGQSAKVDLQLRNREIAFDFQNSHTFGDIELAGSSSLDLSGDRSGSLHLQAKNISLVDNSVIIANTHGSDNGGKLDIRATDRFKLVGSANSDFPSAIFTQVASEATGNGSQIELNATEFQLHDNAIIISSTEGSGDAGEINLQVQQADLANTTGQTFSAGTGLISKVGRNGTGKGSDIRIDVETGDTSDLTAVITQDSELINPGELQLQNGAKITLLNDGQGKSGNLFLNAEQLDILGARSNQNIPSAINTRVDSKSSSAGGNLDINVNSLNIEDGGQIRSSTDGSGDGGDIVIAANQIDIFSLSTETNFLSSITTSAAPGDFTVTGNGGNVTITGDRLTVAEKGFIRSEAKGLGDNGNLQIDTNTLILENGGYVSSNNDGLGNSGRLLVNSQNTTVTGADNSQASGLFASVTRIENNQTTANKDVLPGLELDAQNEPETAAVESNFLVNSSNLSIQNGGKIVSSTSGIADAGDLRIVATDTLEIIDGGEVGSFTSGSGNAGNLGLEVGNIRIGISEESRANFDGDELTKIVPGSLFSRVEENAQGNGGQINVVTQDLQLDYGGQISANTSGAGNAGDIILNAKNVTVQDSIELDGVRRGITSGVESTGIGNGGEIKINVDRDLVVSRGGSIGVDARSANLDPEIEIAAGSINIKASNIVIEDFIDSETVAEFAQSSSLASHISAFSEGSSNSGDVRISAAKLSITDVSERALADRAGILVRNKDLGSAGNIAIDVGELILVGGQLNAEVNSGPRGNVSLKTQSIDISAQGGINTQASGRATSGNIDIDNATSIFLENSKIVADAVQGNAGNIQIDTVGLFLDPNSEITASSKLGIDGVVSLNTSFDAGRNLGDAFPQKPLDSDIKSRQSCEANDDKNNFAYIGRGGLPINPFAHLGSEDVLVDWQETDTTADYQTSFNLQQETSRIYSLNRFLVEQNDTNHKLQEAQEWQINSAGKVELIATADQTVLTELGDRCHAVN
ncbi:MAG: filamentous hemagglutinin N-terminal domain-containing protein [Cyanobacteria bacterium J06600_6]